MERKGLPTKEFKARTEGRNLTLKQIDQVIEANRRYDYEAENFKTCPVCQTTIDYHIHGFHHDQEKNEWICRDHVAEIREIVARTPQPEYNWHRCDEIGSFVAVISKHSLFVVAMLEDGSMEYDEYGQLACGDVDDPEGLLNDLSEFSSSIIRAEMAAF